MISRLYPFSKLSWHSKVAAGPFFHDGLRTPVPPVPAKGIVQTHPLRNQSSFEFLQIAGETSESKQNLAIQAAKSARNTWWFRYLLLHQISQNNMGKSEWEQETLGDLEKPRFEDYMLGVFNP